VGGKARGVGVGTLTFFAVPFVYYHPAKIQLSSN